MIGGDHMQKDDTKGVMLYYSCVYDGILREIEHEMEYGTEDKTEELQYCVERYCNDIVISGHYLEEKLEEYKQAIKTR